MALTSLLALGTAAAIAGVTTLTSEATAFGHRTAAVVTPRAPVSAAPSPTASPAPLSASSSPTASPASPSATPSPSGSAPASADPGVKAGPGSGSGTDVVAPTALPALGTTDVAKTGTESNRVGALFLGDIAAGNHFCSASVIHSSTKNLVITAAHCVSTTDGVHFVPGYRDGGAPYGSWQVTKSYVTDGWSQKSDQDEDFAILEVAPVNGQNIEDVLGGNSIGLSTDFASQVRLYGYPGNREVPILCTNTTGQQDTYQRRVDCPSFASGTSGGPWIDTTSGKIVGVIGGYQQGGDTDDISFSAYFDHTIDGLYQQAVAGSS